MKSTIYNNIFQFIKSLYPNLTQVPLHAPVFCGNEKEYVLDTLETTMVSSVGEYVNKFEDMIAKYTNSHRAVATVNGTSALHVALLLNGVRNDDEVITQALTFVATANAISFCNATPVFIDVDKDTLGMSPNALSHFLKKNAIIKDGKTCNRRTGRKIAACVPMHTFGHPCRIDEIVDICREYNIKIVEDAAESLGSKYKNKHTGTFGDFGVFSLNGNKTITSGCGGAIITNDKNLADRAKHITTTAKNQHQYEYIHDEIAFNYRLANINAALACAQMEQLDLFIDSKRKLSQKYNGYFEKININFINEPKNAWSNFWLNGIVLDNIEERDEFLKRSHENNIQSRPIWRLLNKLPMYKNCQTDNLSNSNWLESRVVNIPSSVIK